MINAYFPEETIVFIVCLQKINRQDRILCMTKFLITTTIPESWFQSLSNNVCIPGNIQYHDILIKTWKIEKV